MDNPIEIGRVKRSDRVEIVIRTGDYMGIACIDIREYLPATFLDEGFTKRGIRIPVEIFPSVLQLLYAIWDPKNPLVFDERR